MRSAEFIQRKFQAWAHRKNIKLQGSEGERGQPNYTFSRGEDLFGGALHPQAEAAFEAGAGGELRGPIPSITALHSSAAMAVNLFQYWLGNQQLQVIAELLNVPNTGIESVSFERKYPVCADWTAHGFHAPPHLDLGIDYVDSGRVIVLLSVLGGACGVLLSMWLVVPLTAISPGALGIAGDVPMDWRVLGVGLGISTLAGLLFGLAPARQLLNVNIHGDLKQSARGGTSAAQRRSGQRS